MNDLMIDLESMGKKPNAPIVSIGAVFFNPHTGELGQEFYTAVSLESAMDQGAVPDGETILWWLKQSPEARSAICVDDAMPITDALSELSHFIHRHAYNLKYMKVWGNGATFDNVILRGAYERAGRICPWEFWNDHDVRTIVTLGRSVGFDPKRDMPFIGDVHNALADARIRQNMCQQFGRNLSLPPAPTSKPLSPGAAGLYGEGNHGKANESESLE
ncbi:phage protein [Enterobacter asburiae]|uniref:Phage protein n=1 Tax=Enterobacter asburiae TaxID=61645 RepID=A0A376FM49_ENTAS|nr:phage protein [Enterobacter asburiae]